MESSQAPSIVTQPLFWGLPFILVKAKQGEERSVDFEMKAEGWELSSVWHGERQIPFYWDNGVEASTSSPSTLRLALMPKRSFEPLRFLFTRGDKRVPLESVPVYCLDPSERKAEVLSYCMLLAQQRALQQVFSSPLSKATYLGHIQKRAFHKVKVPWAKVYPWLRSLLRAKLQCERSHKTDLGWEVFVEMFEIMEYYGTSYSVQQSFVKFVIWFLGFIRILKSPLVCCSPPLPYVFCLTLLIEIKMRLCWDSGYDRTATNSLPAN